MKVSINVLCIRNSHNLGYRFTMKPFMEDALPEPVEAELGQTFKCFKLLLLTLKVASYYIIYVIV